MQSPSWCRDGTGTVGDCGLMSMGPGGVPEKGGPAVAQLIAPPHQFLHLSSSSLCPYPGTRGTWGVGSGIPSEVL